MWQKYAEFRTFALFFLLQDNKVYDIPNVAKGASYFLTDEGLPNNMNFKMYIREAEKYLPNVNSMIDSAVQKLETIYGTEAACFVCGKYYIDSLSKYLNTKLHKKNLNRIDFRAFLIANFDINKLAYVKEIVHGYIMDQSTIDD